MNTDDTILMQRWISGRDADAFVKVAMRHARMVYNVALRILRNPHDAEEVAQDCFEALATTSSPPRENLAGWLYQVAANQAKNRVRSEQRRQNREEEYGAACSTELSTVPDMVWEDMYCHIDEVILTLPKINRDPLVACFFEQKTHEEIAGQLGIPRRTVSNRIHQGIETIRQELRKRGIPVTITAVGTWFDTQAEAISALPSSLTAKIAHIGLAGVGGTVVTGGGVTLLSKLGVMMSTKWVVGGIVTALLIGGVLLGGSKSPQTPTPISAPAAPVISEKEKKTAEFPVRDPSKAEDAVATPVETAAASPAVTPTENDPLASLWGVWSVSLKFAREGEGEREAKQFFEEIRKVGSNMVIRPLEEADGFKMSGPIRGVQIQVTLNDGVSGATVFVGTYVPNADSFTLRGTQMGPDQLLEIKLTFSRANEKLVQINKNRIARQEEIRRIYEALKKYKQLSGGKYPEQLNKVSSYFEGDAALLSSSADREITYQPKEAEDPKAYFSEKSLQWESEVQYADQIVAAEAVLHENGVYDYLLKPALVSIKYSFPSQRISITSLGKIREEGYDVTLSEEEAAKCNDACQNNLKQLGLVVKMFSNEHHLFFPGGWGMVYPEYMSDPTILSCPCRPLGDDSYELLFPGVSEESFPVELYMKVAGNDAAEAARAQSVVPVVVERCTHTMNGKQKRNVLFFDGHVEAVLLADLPQKVERFIRANQ